MDPVSDITQSLPMDDIADRLGVSRGEAESAVATALPTLLAGMGANAADAQGLASLEAAVGQHDDNLLDGGVTLSDVDTDDGDRIVDNVFGAQRQDVVQRLGGAGASSGLVAKLLPILAPIVLSYLAKRLTGRALPGGVGGSVGGGVGGTILLDVLGQVLGGRAGGAGSASQQQAQSQQPSQQSSGNAVEDLITNVLGGVLGGGRRA
ncbi:DUF937 domain-containing protein [Piscicoccus intestinalis]|uniref:DUF937 domain-containing protein n=1 Tax=Piscicoccus intestinalis TaxID=746033 RepID=UPI000A03CCE4|nr:DUF937 domain-containing protein [Piscicoccus intestinalis]